MEKGILHVQCLYVVCILYSAFTLYVRTCTARVHQNSAGLLISPGDIDYLSIYFSK